jgi:hypothetical protein
MRNVAHMVAAGLIALSSLAFVSCGGGGGGASVAPTPAPTNPSNVVSVIVDAGPNSNSVNTLYATVTVCVPGSTTSCQTIDHIQVDTGSNGLRLLASVLTLSLQGTMASNGNSLVECTQFVGAYSWGPIALADIQVGGETASSVPIQVIGGSTFAVDPNCSATGTAQDTVALFGANGILGVGVFEQDCGPVCAPSTTVDNSANGFYYSCTAASVCAGTTVALNSQVLNPIRLFTTDNDGSILDLPSVAAPGATTLTGSLIFGIDTQSNNASGSETILAVDGSGDFTTVFNSQTLTQSFLDSGTNGIFFDDTALQPCPANSNFKGFYCPTGSQSFTATLMGTNNTSIAETFTVDNAQTLATDNPTFSVLPTLAGTWSTIANSNTSNTFDWGLPFYYGRRVITAIENQRTAVGTGPYVAF